MIKKSLIVAGLLLAGTSSLAFDTNKLYVGIGLSSGSGTLTMTDGLTEITGDYDSSSTPIKIGYLLNNDNRFEFSLEKMDNKYSGITDTASGWNIDWDFVYPKELFSPFLTIGFGSYRYNLIDSEDLKGFAINYGVGGLYNINHNLEFEASFKGKTIKWQDVRIGTTTVTSDSVGTAFYIGLNYKF